MEVPMVIVLAVAALALFAIAAVRFGRDSRPTLFSPEHQQAGHGPTWNDLEPAPSDRIPVARRSYPTLALIEPALGGTPGAFTSAPNAAALEVRARQLAAEYWSDTAWTTGIISAHTFERVITELAPYPVAAPIADIPTMAARGHTEVAPAA
jgi:hypothetical protein